MIKGSIHQEDIMVISVYVPNSKAPSYMKHSGEPKEKQTAQWQRWRCSHPRSVMHGAIRQKTKK